MKMNVSSSPNLLFENQIWRIKDTANFLDVSRGHIYNLVSKREIPFIKKGKLLYFVPSEIMNWLLEGNPDEINSNS